MHRSYRAFERPTLGAAVVRLAAVLTLACVFATGCGRQRSIFGSNTPPTLTLTSGPVDTVSVPGSWVVEMAWTATDPDGVIDHFEYALDPPTLHQAFSADAETAWTSTRETRTTARFRARSAHPLEALTAGLDFHTFALRAVDDRGGVSPLVIRAFYATNVAPDVRITRPVPSALLRAYVPLPFRIEWEGDDTDGQGQGSGKGRAPDAYRIRLLDLDDPGNTVYLANPDSLIRQGAGTDWQDWRLVDGDTTFHDVTESEIGIGRSGLFAVLAVDKKGATTPYASLNQNLLQFTTAYPGSASPLIHIWSPVVDYTYPSGGYSLDPSREIPVQIGVATQLELRWDGRAASGRELVSSRWMLDGDVFDDTPRSDPSDLVHWSAPGPPASETQLPPLSAGVHRFYVEVMDDFGEKSLGIVKIDVLDIAPTRDLLVIDDTRLEVDKFTRVPGSIPQAWTLNPYTSPWPSATELDTFLFARGGFPWRQTKNPTSGVISTPGLLAGYSFDTLGTRRGIADDPAQGITLAQLGQYRHVLWLVDDRGATFIPSLDQGLFPVTVLRGTSAPGRASLLGGYVEFGGQVWLAGGATAYASLVNFDRFQNNSGPSTVFSAALGELAPGRPMYDHAHVRSAMSVSKSGSFPTRSAAAIGGWSGHGPTGTLAAPDYSQLPPAMRLRTPDTDPLPPTRLASHASLFYVTSTPKEYVLEPNAILEDFDPKLHVTRLESTLDTLYEAPNPLTSFTPRPVMLYYHGRDNAPFVFTGFDVWSWARADCQALVDFVLGDIWGLARSGPATRPARSATLTPGKRTAALPTTRHVRR